MDTSGQLQLLQLSADELRKSLPSTLHEERIGGDVLDQLNRRLHEIEARVQTALMRALQTQQQQQQEEQGMNAEEEEERGIQKKQQFAERRMPPTKDNRREGAGQFREIPRPSYLKDEKELSAKQPKIVIFAFF